MTEPELPPLHDLKAPYEYPAGSTHPDVTWTRQQVYVYAKAYGLACYRQAWAEAAMKCAEACNQFTEKHQFHSNHMCAAACERVGKEMGE